MTKTKLTRTAIRLFRNPQVEKTIQRHNQRKWLEAIAFLGDRWVYAKPIQKVVVRNQHL